jgi:small GTP-binding protein
LRFVDGSYKPASRTSTIGAFFLTKRVTVNNITCKVLIWDTAGQEKFQKLTVTYYQNAAAAIICYDVSNPNGLQRLQKNLEELERYKQNKPMVLVVAACKRDLPAVPRMEEEAQKLAASYDALYMETSAKANRGVSDLFLRTAARVLERHEAALQGQDRPLPVTVGDAARDRLSPAVSRRQHSSPTHVVEGTLPFGSHHQQHHHVMETKDKMADEESCTENESDEVVDEVESPTNRKGVTCEGSYLVCGVDDAGKGGCVIL